MAFVSRNQRNVREGRNRRDKGAIVGLSGWLFADLLLGVAVVFLIGSERPSSAGINESDRPTVSLNALENVQPNQDIWSVNDRSFKIEVVFSEEVRDFDVSDLSFTGEANGWFGQIIEPQGLNVVSDRFVVNIDPSQDLVAGEFAITIPESAAYSAKNGSGNAGTKKLLKVVNCFEYKGIDPEALQKVNLSGGYLKGENEIIQILSKDLDSRIKNRDQVGFLILFGGGKDGSVLAERSADKIRSSLASLGLVPKADAESSNADSCGVSVSENDFPILYYKNDGQSRSDLQLNIYFMNK